MSPKITKRQECLIYSRVCGWLTSTGQFNKGKKAEFADRKEFEINEKDFK
jgi:anaerobic ribonucleoside-triphosphate reductase